MPGATSTASCAGVPSGAGWSSSSGWRWPTPPSSVAGSSAAPGPTIAGKAVLAAAHERLLAQALSLRFNPCCLRRASIGGGSAGVEAGWVGQAALVVVGRFFLGFLVGFLIAG